MSQNKKNQVDPQELRDLGTHFHHVSADIQQLAADLRNATADLDTGAWTGDEAARLNARFAEAEMLGQRRVAAHAELGDLLLRAADALLEGALEWPPGGVLLRRLGAGLDAAGRNLFEPVIITLGIGAEVQYNLGRLGVVDIVPSQYDPAVYADLISHEPSDPFTGPGVTGEHVLEMNVPLGDQLGLFLDQKGIVSNPDLWNRYYNPLGALNGYLAGLSSDERRRQVELLVSQPVVSVEDCGSPGFRRVQQGHWPRVSCHNAGKVWYAPPQQPCGLVLELLTPPPGETQKTQDGLYEGVLPPRQQIIAAAAAQHNLEPELVTAFILAEQRDQSALESAVEYTAAVSIVQHSSSIGLGQVTIKTAQSYDLFADLLSAETRQNLSHKEVARLLASDEINVFATARYIRIVADQGASTNTTTLPITQQQFPNIDMDAYGQNSASWPDDNIRALASEYTSEQWDDIVFSYWGNFVFKAYTDTLSGRLFP